MPPLARRGTHGSALPRLLGRKHRQNAQKSTGPRSELGRLHSRRNALRHGLAIGIGSDPSFGKDIDALDTNA